LIASSTSGYVFPALDSDSGYRTSFAWQSFSLKFLWLQSQNEVKLFSNQDSASS